MHETPRPSNNWCKCGKAFLYCNHALARGQFAQPLLSAGFAVTAYNDFRLPDSPFEDDPPALAVIDAGNQPQAIAFVRQIRLEQRHIELLVLLPWLIESSVFPLLRLGVKGVVSYQQCEAELARAATQVSKGGYWVPREFLTRFVQSILPELQKCRSLESETGISRREREVLDLLLDGFSNKEIAARLFVSERTVKFHVSNLLSKFGVQRRADLIVWWMQRASAPLPIPTPEMGRSLSSRVN